MWLEVANSLYLVKMYIFSLSIDFALLSRFLREIFKQWRSVSVGEHILSGHTQCYSMTAFMKRVDYSKEICKYTHSWNHHCNQDDYISQLQKFPHSLWIPPTFLLLPPTYPATRTSPPLPTLPTDLSFRFHFECIFFLSFVLICVWHKIPLEGRKTWILKRLKDTVTYQVNPPLIVPACYMGSISSPGYSTFSPAPCWWLCKAVEHVSRSWVPTPTWESRKKLLTSSSCHGSHLGSESLDERSISLFPLSLSITLISKQSIKWK